MKKLFLALSFSLSLFIPATVSLLQPMTAFAITCNGSVCVNDADYDAQGLADCNAACADQAAQAANATLPSSSSSNTISSSSGSVVTLINPLGTTDPRLIIGNLIKALLSIIGSVTLLMFIYGGVLWITSMGNDKLVAKGKAVLVWTTIGLAVVAGAYTLTSAVITGLTECSVVPGGPGCST